MPYSDSQGKDKIADWIEYHAEYNSRFLDIGPGSGAYADLIRSTYLGIYPTIDAIEVWGPYVEKFGLDKKYRQVIISDVNYIDPICISGYDFVIIGDVIEHMTKFEARRLLDFLIRNNDFVIVSFPVLHLDQGKYEGNPYETHKDHWTFDEMIEFSNTNFLPVLDCGHGDVLGWFLFSRHQGRTPCGYPWSQED